MPAQPGPGWASAGTLAGARVGHTATLLDDGRVLVVGGLDIEGALSAGIEVMGRTSAELYDPETGIWSATGSMSVGRAFQSATRLPDGTVLVAGGGEEDKTAGRSAELYDPATSRWTAVSSMSTDRFSHSAFLLSDGSVLVVGGHGIGSDPVAHASAERYDPVAQSWTPAAGLETPTYGEVGVVLTDGRVLLIQDAFNVPATTVTYDPAADAWSESGSMGLERHGFPLAPLPGGRVLAPGGGVGMVDGVLSAAQVFDPLSGMWQETGSMALQRLSFTATALLDGRVIAIGGGGADDAGARSAEIYEPVAGTWSTVGSMSYPRFGHTATLLADGSVLVVGGYSGAQYVALDAAERYVPPSP